VSEPLILAIECSTPRASLALWRGENLCNHAFFSSDRSHNAELFRPLGELLEQIGGEEQLDLVVVGTGPGSYSGTRVGIAAAQGVALVHGCPVVGVSSLLAVEDQDSVWIGDARRGNAWWAEARHRCLVSEPQLVTVAELTEKLESFPESRLCCLEPVDKLGLPESLILKCEKIAPEAIWLKAAWQAMSDENQARLLETPVQPAYLQAPHITVAKPGHPLLRKGR
jgi:tRNA threonylcarbamoyladenosine biosynthesis protein TsaB